ncbi:Na(+)/H(+) antiporter NhaD [Marinobacterium sp. xm-a-121]|jgi:Na+/H+ antiporter NhaD/arsenite permease-like protein|uniref:sodium:proton antiporter NhaD n=1 Tax=unclassified Marinobacterium TaxID=2644139 RepID=UPI00156A3545|nr:MULTISPECIES: sodium:proton antiporter NhaD [unclassified Marinobacterium]NRP39256.1 Na(+)/H(+) antiporter NhaD [Marinobacterium sp. xm-a-121]NRP59160.1 Na(+)/H(+) antiporter NhaD [Marinobacterium sp. xm-d-564]NRQ00126.1 Na(+)/H(+) antiporter NhaD [Marinobacterium sp. xm-v-233]
MLHYTLIAFALIALLAIVFEEVIHLNKAKSTLFLGTLSWILIFLFPEQGVTPEQLRDMLNENLLDIAGLWLFLMSAMTFVAFLNHQGLIETLIYRLLPSQISERKLIFLVGIFSFVFSSLCDNITATLVSIALVLSLGLERRKTLRLSVLVVFAVNSGGVSLITGDVTTLMVFLAGKVEITDLLLLSVPAFVSTMLLAAMLSRPLVGQVIITPTPRKDDKVGKVIAVIFLATIISTIILNIVAGIPPVLTFLFGLSTMFLLGRFLYEEDTRENLLDYVRRIEFDTLMFFLGILLLVGMLKEIGTLDSLVGIYQVLPITVANFAMGVFSAFVDNVPLTAALLKSGVEMSKAEWLSLTYSVGVGGSLLAIGSAAGIVAMSKVDILNFGSYARYVVYLSIAFLVGYLSSYLLGSYFV